MSTIQVVVLRISAGLLEIAHLVSRLSFNHSKEQKVVFIPGIEPGTLSDQSSSCERLGFNIRYCSEADV